MKKRQHSLMNMWFSPKYLVCTWLWSQVLRIIQQISSEFECCCIMDVLNVLIHSAAFGKKVFVDNRTSEAALIVVAGEHLNMCFPVFLQQKVHARTSIHTCVSCQSINEDAVPKQSLVWTGPPRQHPEIQSLKNHPGRTQWLTSLAWTNVPQPSGYHSYQGRPFISPVQTKDLGKTKPF